MAILKDHLTKRVRIIVDGAHVILARSLAGRERPSDKRPAPRSMVYQNRTDDPLAIWALIPPGQYPEGRVEKIAYWTLIRITRDKKEIQVKSVPAEDTGDFKGQPKRQRIEDFYGRYVDIYPFNEHE